MIVANKRLPIERNLVVSSFKFLILCVLKINFFCIFLPQKFNGERRKKVNGGEDVLQKSFIVFIVAISCSCSS